MVARGVGHAARSSTILTKRPTVDDHKGPPFPALLPSPLRVLMGFFRLMRIERPLGSPCDLLIEENNKAHQ